MAQAHVLYILFMHFKMLQGHSWHSWLSVSEIRRRIVEEYGRMGMYRRPVLTMNLCALEDKGYIFYKKMHGRSSDRRYKYAKLTEIGLEAYFGMFPNDRPSEEKELEWFDNMKVIA